ncbi:PD40 domain-containing protein [Aeromonas salmonicida]|uniref:PD40 domain-containing protein n=1 Tax=Aeromonas salmonicida TaxID=645 RepID=UPI0009D6D6BF|nr:PD40 domain-containing protein [Aeromonas salmonicida]
MRCRLSLLILLILLICSPLQAAEPLWLREPALSPDGKQLAFTWQGRVYLSAGDGGLAMPLTDSDYLSQRPLWSPDGKQIAFAANWPVSTMAGTSVICWRSWPVN